MDALVPYAAHIAIGALVTLLCGVAGAIHLVEWHLYVSARTQRDSAREALMLMIADRDSVRHDRDGWRAVADQSMLLLQFAQSVSRRATEAVTQQDNVHA